MTEEQRKDALEAIDRLEEDAIFNQDNCFHRVHAVEDVNIIRSALKAPPVPVIEGLEEAIHYTIGLLDESLKKTDVRIKLGQALQAQNGSKKSNMLLKIIDASFLYSKLQKGE